MGRRKINRFTNSKMLAARVEQEDYYKFELVLKKDHKSLQDAINTFVVNYISGNISFSGTQIVTGKV